MYCDVSTVTYSKLTPLFVNVSNVPAGFLKGCERESNHISMADQGAVNTVSIQMFEQFSGVHGPMLYPLFSYLSNVSAVMMIWGLHYV